MLFFIQVNLVAVLKITKGGESVSVKPGNRKGEVAYAERSIVQLRKPEKRGI